MYLFTTSSRGVSVAVWCYQLTFSDHSTSAAAALLLGVKLFSESKRCFSPADATKEQNIHHESLLLLLLLLRQSGPELRCVCCALIVTDGTLKTAIFDTRDKNIDNAIKIKPYCRICAVNSNTGDPWIHTVWRVRWTFFFLLIISSQVFFWGWAGLLGHGWINILTYLRAPF